MQIGRPSKKKKLETMRKMAISRVGQGPAWTPDTCSSLGCGPQWPSRAARTMTESAQMRYTPEHLWNRAAHAASCPSLLHLPYGFALSTLIIAYLSLPFFPHRFHYHLLVTQLLYFRERASAGLASDDPARWFALFITRNVCRLLVLLENVCLPYCSCFILFSQETC